ncbi:nuclear transport factor 2 family protein [Herbidospora daliensis]|uniref:nuclear transport factor 2 family protein n=1 Tax=Herbidospora daliensis TaxID=295585 RepID=UPI000782152E|nr:nuclear transport factor 2 family protein [Herbidospora daliensis]
MTTIDDVEEIKRLKARYFRFHDLKMWDAFLGLFTPDVHIEIGDTVMRDPAAMVRITSAWVGDATTVHRGFMPEIDVTGPDTATGVWSMDDYLVWPEKDGLTQGMRGYGHYYERYRKIDGSWLISALRLDRLKVEVFEGGLPPVPTV